jgi:hypothetical protein
MDGSWPHGSHRKYARNNYRTLDLNEKRMERSCLRVAAKPYAKADMGTLKTITTFQSCFLRISSMMWMVKFIRLDIPMSN